MQGSPLSHQPGAFPVLVSAMTVKYSDPLFWYHVESLSPLTSFHSYLRYKEYHQRSKWPGLEESKKGY